MNATPDIETIREAAVEVLRPYVSRIALFGSVARGEADAGSDIDLLVTLRPDSERPPLGLKWFQLERDLADRLGRPVEIATEDALSRHLRPYIQEDLKVLYEE